VNWDSVLIFPFQLTSGRSTSKGDPTPPSAAVSLLGTNGHDVVNIYLNLVAVCGGTFHPSWQAAPFYWVGCQVTQKQSCSHARQLVSLADWVVHHCVATLKRCLYFG
jgi:hypothetical protein